MNALDPAEVDRRARAGRPVTLAEAARRFKHIGRGPSRTTLSRDATAKLLNTCRELNATRTRPLYRFEDLCSFYAVDPHAPAPKPATAKPEAPNQSPPIGTGDVAALAHQVAELAGQLAELRKLMVSTAREVRDLIEVRRALQLKYDAENGLLRQKADAAEEKVRLGANLETLSREVSSTRQGVSRLAESLG
jgi:hypothetical protein